jgi:hypothetical protein
VAATPSLAGVFVQPATLPRWHRDVVRRRCSHPHRRGRPAIAAELGGLVPRLAREHPTWGSRRSTVGCAAWAPDARSQPAPYGPCCTAPVSIRTQALGGLLATVPSGTGQGVLVVDFFIVDTVCLQRLEVLLVLEVGTRRVQLLAVTPHPIGDWVTQQARNLPMELEDRGRRLRFLLRDPDTAAFDAVFTAEGIQCGARRSGRHRPTPTQSGGWAPFGARWWTGCGSWPSAAAVGAGRARRPFQPARPHRALGAGTTAWARRAGCPGTGWEGRTTRSTRWVDP